MSEPMFAVECTAPNGDRRTKDGLESKPEAQAKIEELKDLGFHDFEITTIDNRGNGSDASTQAENTSVSERSVVVEDGPQKQSEPPQEATQAEEQIPAEKPGLDTDPVDYMPAHFVDHIQGVPTLNRKGYAVMAERFNVSVTAEPVVRASETDFEYAEFQAIAKTEDGTEDSGFGSAHVDRGDGDDEYLLNELAETRALKRACSWALGLGMTAREEMTNEL